MMLDEIKENWSEVNITVIFSDISDDRLKEKIRLSKISSDIDSRIEQVPFRPELFVDKDPLVWEIKRKGIRIFT